MDGWPELTAAEFVGLRRELDAGPGWVPVRPEEVPGLFASYERARTCTVEVREALAGAGFGVAEFPELCASVDAGGAPVVVLGPVGLGTARRLAAVLRRPAGPGERERRAA